MNTGYRNLIAILSPLFLAACGQSLRQQCEADISSGLLNPETAKFYDFEGLSEVELETFFTDIRERNIKFFAGDEDRAFHARMHEMYISAKLYKNEEVTDLTFYKIRVRAAGELGNVITKQPRCIVSDGPGDSAGCFCSITD